MENERSREEEFLKDIVMAEWDRLREKHPNATITVWDAFISLASDKEDSYVLMLKADLEILKKIAEGHSLIKISRSMNIPSKTIRRVAAVWGMEPLTQTLDFNPLMVYNKGMSWLELMSKVEGILPNMPDEETLRTAHSNVERYIDLFDFLGEIERER